MAGYKLYEDKKGALNPTILAITSIAVIFTLLSMFDLNIKNLAVTQNHIPVLLAIIASAAMIAAIAWSCYRTYKVDNTLNEALIFLFDMPVAKALNLDICVYNYQESKEYRCSLDNSTVSSSFILLLR